MEKKQVQNSGKTGEFRIVSEPHKKTGIGASRGHCPHTNTSSTPTDTTSTDSQHRIQDLTLTFVHFHLPSLKPTSIQARVSLCMTGGLLNNLSTFSGLSPICIATAWLPGPTIRYSPLSNKGQQEHLLFWEIVLPMVSPKDIFLKAPQYQDTVSLDIM